MLRYEHRVTEHRVTERRVTVRRPLRQAIALIDLVITLLIIGILAAVAAPRFAASYASLQLEAAARRVAGDLNYARKSAVTTCRITQVAFRTSPMGFDMTGVVHPGYPGQSYSCELSDIAPGASFDSINFDHSSTLTFNVYGRPQVSGVGLVSGSVVLRFGDQLKTVAINTSTGEAIVQ